jgi:hypothetical protein
VRRADNLQEPQGPVQACCGKTLPLPSNRPRWYFLFSAAHYLEKNRCEINKDEFNISCRVMYGRSKCTCLEILINAGSRNVPMCKWRQSHVKVIVIQWAGQYDLPLGHFAVETRSVTRSSQQSVLYILGTYRTSCAHYKLITCATGACFMAHQIKFSLQCSEGLHVISYRILFWTPLRSACALLKVQASQVLSHWQLLALCSVPKYSTESSWKHSDQI